MQLTWKEKPIMLLMILCHVDRHISWFIPATSQFFNASCARRLVDEKLISKSMYRNFTRRINRYRYVVTELTPRLVPISEFTGWILIYPFCEISHLIFPLQCKKCGKSFPDRYTYKIHLKTHEGEKCFKCELCPYAALSQRHLESHILTHTGEKPFQCDECELNFL